MNEIKCPHCQTVFTINESEYAQLLAQVRSGAFEKEVNERLEKETALLKEQSKNQLQSALAQKDLELEQLKGQLETRAVEQEQEVNAAIALKDKALVELQARFDSLASEKQHELKTALAEKDLELEKLQGQLAAKSTEQELEVRSAIAPKDQEIAELKARLERLELEKAHEMQQALQALEKERDTVQNQLVLQEQQGELSRQALINQHQLELAQKDDLIAYYKDFKAKQSTKMIGESLEQHCEYEFNRLRMTAFPRAEFGKDNDATSGSKGDYIYREYDENGVEIISIMFEMKNEGDETATKKKNEHFFKELDKDRREKKCEYAILVSLLEADNELYNNGIVDVSYTYEKMYVVRPQFFIPIITLLRNAALNSLKYKQELELVKEQNLDITHFEEDLETFKSAFAKNYNSASNNFKKAIEEIDKSIKRMEAVKVALTTSENQLRLANNKLDDVSVQKLTRKNPTMKAKFEALKE
ncbi:MULTISPECIES: DUF2130 domain-containing protein [Streptococcus]|uniref:DUF2130 domain-containing protein n=1 Tax=Streptococcus caledonicus TaxID=2614158 RepID=A0ABW0UC81_9STRE|nr:DUF2130 domain-containing protein [Streptococcus sp. S784/96/1]